MDIAEKALRLKQDFDYVKMAGYIKGEEIGYSQGYVNGNKQGRTDEWHEFWDNLQQNGTRIHYQYAFAYTGWTDTNFNPKYHITPTNASGIANMFMWNQNITNTKVPITALGSAQNTFYACNRLVTIPKLIFNGTTNVNGMFYNCTKLTNLTCEGELAINGLDISACTRLTPESLMSVINCLAPTSATLTATFGADNLAKLTDEEKAIATEKGWTLA